jgi:hypothetical protein
MHSESRMASFERRPRTGAPAGSSYNPSRNRQCHSSHPSQCRRTDGARFLDRCAFADGAHRCWPDELIGPGARVTVQRSMAWRSVRQGGPGSRGRTGRARPGACTTEPGSFATSNALAVAWPEGSAQTDWRDAPRCGWASRVVGSSLSLRWAAGSAGCASCLCSPSRCRPARDVVPPATSRRCGTT